MSTTKSPEMQREQYTVGWICALSIEAAAAKAMLDETHPRLPSVNASDSNAYAFGRVGEHHVVIATLPLGSYGTTSAAVVATNMLSSFPNVRFGLMVGIGGGIPSEDNDIRLGDIVVSKPDSKFGGVVQMDSGKVTTSGYQRTGALNRPPTALLTALSQLEAEHILGSELVPIYLLEAYKRFPSLKTRYRHPGLDSDILYQAEYDHARTDASTCQGCDADQIVLREPRETQDPMIHYGVIGSSNSVIKDGVTRDRLREEHGLLCFEMEAAGLMNDFPCLVIRGICDYSDSHKNKRWQEHAAIAAAAFAKELLYTLPALQVGAIPKAIEVLRGISEKIERISDQIRESDNDRLYRNINVWLSPPDPSTNYNTALQKRHPGSTSGAWLISSNVFSTWKSSPKASLWLHGLAGCGKTVLSSSIIEALRRNTGTDADDTKNPIVLYFFFDFNDTKKQSLEQMGYSLVCQLYQQNEESQELLNLLFVQCRNGSEKPPTEKLLSTFLGMLSAEREVYVVLDALDECPAPRIELLGWIRKLACSLPVGLHLIVTSRKEVDINLALGQTSVIEHIIPIQADPVDEDIRAYVCHSLKNDERFEWLRGRKGIRDEIETELGRKSNGMFRWAACQLDDIAFRCNDRPTIRQALASLPETLDETYARILRSVPALQRNNTIRILQFLLYSNRHLRVEEAVDAIAVNLAGSPCFDPEDRMPSSENIIKYCSSLVIITRTRMEFDEKMERMYMDEPYDWTQCQEHEVLQLAHFSVQQYFMSDKVEPTWKDCLSEICAYVSNAKVCLAYCAQLQQDVGTKTTTIVEKYPFALYSTRHWKRYAARAGGHDEVLCASIHHFLLQNKKAFENHFRLCELSYTFKEVDQNTLCFPEPLFIASKHNLVHSVDSLLREGLDINAVYLDEGSALGVASAMGHREIVQLLLDRGAKVDMAGLSDLIPPVARCYFKTVQILLEHGANPNLEDEGDPRRYTSLQHAVGAGNVAMTKMLLDKGAINNAGQDDTQETPLDIAVRKGHLGIIRILLETPSYIGARDRVGRTLPLHFAAERNHLNMMRLLLQSELQTINRVAGEHQKSPLIHSAEHGNVEAVKLFLAAGASVFVQDKHGETALHYAAEKGHLEVVKVLVEAGSNLSALDSTQRTPMACAQQRDRTSVVEWLMSYEQSLVGHGDGSVAKERKLESTDTGS